MSEDTRYQKASEPFYISNQHTINMYLYTPNALQNVVIFLYIQTAKISTWNSLLPFSPILSFRLTTSRNA